MRRLQGEPEPTPYDIANASTIEWLAKARPNGHWTVPFVTRKRYYLRWLDGLDFEELKIRIEPAVWDKTKDQIELVIQF